MGISDAYVMVNCDGEGCSEEFQVELTSLAGRGCWDERNVASAIKGAGWLDKDGRQLCDMCRPDREDDD